MRVIKKVVELIILTSLVIPASVFASGRPSEDANEIPSSVTRRSPDPSPDDSQSQVVMSTTLNAGNQDIEEVNPKILEIYYKSLEDAGDKSGGRSPLPREVVFQIYDFLSIKDWCNLALVSTDMKESIEAYKEDVVNRLANQFDKQLSNTFVGKIISCYINRNSVLIASFTEKVHTRMEEESSVFVSEDSAVIPYLPRNFNISKIDLSYNDLLKNLKGSSKLYKAFFRKRFPLQNNELRKIALHHLESIWFPKGYLFYKNRTDDDDGLQQFMQKEKDSVLENYKTGGYRLPYFSLLSEKDDISQLSWRPHNIVITGKQLGDRNFRELIENIFRANPEHILTLSLGKCGYSKKGRLRIYGDTLPKTIKHLVLTDPSGSVTSIGRLFLDKTTISSLTLSGFPHLDDITYGFCNNASELRSVEISKLSNLAQIDDFCFAGCTNIEFISLLNLPSLTSIGKGMCKDVTTLPTWKISNLPQLRLLGGETLTDLRKEYWNTFNNY